MFWCSKILAPIIIKCREYFTGVSSSCLIFNSNLDLVLLCGNVAIIWHNVSIRFNSLKWNVIQKMYEIIIALYMRNKFPDSGIKLYLNKKLKYSAKLASHWLKVASFSKKREKRSRLQISSRGIFYVYKSAEDILWQGQRYYKLRIW